MQHHDPSHTSAESYDAIIIGGGPAGASSGAILAEHGHNVLILEREKFPRYHIGESLLPFTFHPLQRLGLIEKMRASAFVKKYSVQFVSPSGKASQPFYFFNRYEKDVAQTWQVLRSEFDLMLLNHARDNGATVREETIVNELLHREGRVVGVRATNKQGKSCNVYAPITIDCSGREAFAAVRNGWRMGDPELHKAAVWTYYKGAKRDSGIDAGATTVAFVPEKGWFWYIPLHDDLVSVGVVAEGRYLSRLGLKDTKAIFDREVTQNKWIEEYLAPGQQTGDYFITGEYTYHSKYCATEGLLLAGDAFCFLDPVFSSGVLLALKSGVMAGDAIHEAIVARDFSPARFTDYGKMLREGLENMRKLVYAFYNENFSFRSLTDKYPDLASDITDCLSGDVNKDFSKLFNAITEFAPVPEPLPCGLPLTKSEPAMQLA
ncbi:MAG TPA: NAD(P)/FAD-dependent oxidoreductase [Verrucomicrobiae bacterium]|jgi:flavin-dependent dehydrogenase|nr:NAD(P)/FAD-dependent oxidoreductase [Verrucomicrobiae bacterium]